MTASFDKNELMAGLAELEKRVREHRTHEKPAASPEARLDIDLAAMEAAARSRGAAKRAPAPVEGPKLSVAAHRDQPAPPKPAALDLGPELRVPSLGKGVAPSAKPLDALRERTSWSPSKIDLFAAEALRTPAARSSHAPAVADATREAGGPSQEPAPPSLAIEPPSDSDQRVVAAAPESAPSRPHRWIYAAAAIVIVIGSLLGGVGYLASGKVMAALRSPTAPQNFDPSPQAAAPAPAPESSAELASAAPAAAGQTAALQGGDAAPLADPAPRAASAQAALAAPLGAAAAAAVPASSPAAAAPPPAAKAASIAEPSAGATTPTSESAAVKPAKPAKKPKKPTADKSEEKDSKAKRHAKDKEKEKADKLARPRSGPEASRPLPAQPQAMVEAPPPPPPAAPSPDPGVLGRAGQAVGSITGTVKGWVGLDSAVH